jgi:hypothetical protein
MVIWVSVICGEEFRDGVLGRGYDRSFVGVREREGGGFVRERGFLEGFGREREMGLWWV